MISVIIPAHNESAVIARTLRTLINTAGPGELEIVVVCNGCTDDTPAVARRFGLPVRVVETNLASKTHALNVGDAVACSFPRVYLDADVVVTSGTLRCMARRLETGDVLAVAPRADVDLSGCSWPVRVFYEVRSLLPSASEGIGGSGVYALSEAGRQRFRIFPAITADDGYVRLQFRPEERETLDFVASTVFPPRTIKALLAIRTRAHYGSFELKNLYPQLWENRIASNNQALTRLFHDPRLWLKLAIYCLISLVAQHRAKRRVPGGRMRWERDNTSRATA